MWARVGYCGLGFWGFAIAALAAGRLAAAQTPASAASPNVRGNSESTGPGYQLQMRVPLVLEDLVVTDRKGQPVHGLKAGDLKVTEDGSQVVVRSFDEHAAKPRSYAEIKLPDLGPNTYTNALAKPDSDAWNILLLDALNTPATDQDSVRRQMLEYVKTLPVGVPIAIFALDTRLRLLQGFTADPNLLRTAIEQRGKDQHLSPLIAMPISDHQDDDLRMPTKLSQIVTGVSPEGIAAIQRVEGDQEAGKTQRRGIDTGQALVELGRYLAGLPGRKNLIWFAGSFPLGALPQVLVNDRVALYPVDARGLEGEPPCVGIGCVATLRAMQHQEIEQATQLNDLARSTGGQAFSESNDLKAGIERAISDGDNYYTFTYTPPDDKLDGRYRKVEVKVNRPALSLSYRTGYFAIAPEAGAAQESRLEAIQMAARPGAPAATEILFDVRVSAENELVAQLTAGAKPTAALMKTPYRRYELIYRVAVGDALFAATPDGLRHGALSFVALVYNQDGALVNMTNSEIKMDWPEKRYAEMVNRGLTASQVVEGPEKGDYLLRVVVYDPNGDRTGTIEAPLAGVKSRQAVIDASANAAQSNVGH